MEMSEMDEKNQISNLPQRDFSEVIHSEFE